MDDPYSDPRFNQDVDKQTGYLTHSLLCAPIRTTKGEVIGVLQVLNKQEGLFTKDDLRLLEEMTSLCAITLRSRQFMDGMHAGLANANSSSSIWWPMSHPNSISAPCSSRSWVRPRGCCRATGLTLFLNDEKTNELFSRVAMGDSIGGNYAYRITRTTVVAVFTSGHTINTQHAYADLRFQPGNDQRTGYFTRSILCVPIMNKAGKTIGVTQVLNRKECARLIRKTKRA